MPHDSLLPRLFLNTQGSLNTQLKARFLMHFWHLPHLSRCSVSTSAAAWLDPKVFCKLPVHPLEEKKERGDRAGCPPCARPQNPMVFKCLRSYRQHGATDRVGILRKHSTYPEPFPLRDGCKCKIVFPLFHSSLFLGLSLEVLFCHLSSLVGDVLTNS